VTTDSNFTVGTLNINVADGTVAVSNSIGATGTTNVFADDGVTSSGAGVINGDIVVLDTNASLGVDAANRLQINANTFQVEGQNVFVNNTNTLASTLNASSATNTLDVSTAGDLVSGGDYSAQVVALATGGAFDLTSTINGTTSVSLTTDGDLTNITGTLNTPTLLLNSVSGNVGTDANNPFLVAANVSSIGGSAGNGFFVSSASTAGVNFVAITAAGDINLTANGGLNLTQNITSTGGASLSPRLKTLSTSQMASQSWLTTRSTSRCLVQRRNAIASFSEMVLQFSPTPRLQVSETSTSYSAHHSHQVARRLHLRSS
jgi:hypothetical protein